MWRFASNSVPTRLHKTKYFCNLAQGGNLDIDFTGVRSRCGTIKEKSAFYNHQSLSEKGAEWKSSANRSGGPRYKMVVGLANGTGAGCGQETNLTGEVSDAMCGAKHQMPGKAAECTSLHCDGSQYALVVGDKVYILQTSDRAALDKLNELAGAKAKVTGEVDGTTMTVKSVVKGS